LSPAVVPVAFDARPDKLESIFYVESFRAVFLLPSFKIQLPEHNPRKRPFDIPLTSSEVLPEMVELKAYAWNVMGKESKWEPERGYGACVCLTGDRAGDPGFYR
jgi:hypothetical protein